MEATSETRRILPQTRVIILSQHDSPEMMRQAFKMGASGYVIKTAVGRDLLGTIDKLGDGAFCFFSPANATASSNLDLQEILQRSKRSKQPCAKARKVRAIVDATPECVKFVAPDGTLVHITRPAWT